MNYGPVAIFWDYENCSPQHGAGFAVVDNIRQIAHQYGSVKLFKAYLELSEQNSTKSLNLRSELQSCGVSLTDCPHNGRKDVADKMMIVDMLAYAIDTPAPATVILISGDRDFVYAVSVLRLRQYHVVVVAPATAHISLRSRAAVVHDWETEVLGRDARPSHGPHISVDTSAGHSWGDQEQRPGHNSMPSTGSVARSSRRHSFRESGSSTPINDTGNSRSPSKASRQNMKEDSTQDALNRPQLNVSFSFPNTPASHRAHAPESAKPGDTGTPVNHSARGSLSVPLKGLSPAPADTNLLSPISPASSNTVLTPPEAVVSDDPSHASCSTTSRNNADLKDDGIPITDPIGNAYGSLPAQKTGTDNQTTSYSHPSAADMLPLGPLSPGTPAGSDAAWKASMESLPHMSSDPHDSNEAPLHTAERQGTTSCPEPDVNVGVRADLFGNPPRSSDVPIIAFPASSPSVPPAFAHMVEILDKARREGEPRILRSVVALQLKERNTAVYEDAGVTKFRDYTAIAHSMGLIELGGIGGTAWIALASSQPSI